MLAVTFFSFVPKIYAISDIKVKGFNLVPSFDEYTMKYNVFVNSDTESIDVSVGLTSSDDYVTGIGNIALSNGINEVILKVIKKDASILTYQINIFKNYNEIKDKDNANIKNIIISNHNINFDPNIKEYDIEVTDEENLDIECITESENSSVRITGNSNFKVGKNIVRIIITSNDKTNVNSYVLNVNKLVSTFNEENSIKEEVIKEKEFTKKETNIIILIIVAICSILLVLIFYILFHVRRKIS